MKVRIGSLVYEVQLLSEEELDGGDANKTYGGCLNPMKCSILLNKDLPKQVVVQSFLHECVHGMLDEIGEHELYVDEGLVDALAKQIYTLITQNNIKDIVKKLESRNGG